MQFSDALSIARSGRALVFLGSGFSLGAVSISDQRIPKTAELARRLMKAAGEDEEAEFDLAADLFIRVNLHNPTALNQFLEKQFSVKQISSAQENIARYPWGRVYTTNYDNIYEIAAKRCGADFISASWQNPPSQYSDTNKWVVHLHGYIGDVAKSGTRNPFLIGRKSYIELELLKTQWPTQLQVDLAKASAIFVVGFSFSDIHIARLFRVSKTLKRKTFVIVHPSENTASKSYAAAQRSPHFRRGRRFG